MSALEHAKALYGEMLVSMRKFRDAERLFDQVTAEHRERVRHEQGYEPTAELPRMYDKLAQQNAARDPLQVQAAAQCRYFMNRTQVFALAYQVEVDYHRRFTGDQV